jgi:hypothetical protein
LIVPTLRRGNDQECFAALHPYPDSFALDLGNVGHFFLLLELVERFFKSIFQGFRQDHQPVDDGQEGRALAWARFALNSAKRG